MFLCRKSLVAPFVVFLRFVLCFRGARRSAMMLSCVFATSRTICAFFFIPSGHFLVVFLCFFVSWTNLLVSGDLLCSFFASWIRKGTYLCQLAPPDHQLGGKWGHKVDFCPSPGVAFRTTFFTFSYFSEFCDFVKIELPCRRELGFRGSGRSKCHFLSLGTPFKNRSEFGGS